MTTTVVTDRTGPLTANSADPLPFTFQALSAAEIEVYLDDVLVDPNDYTVVLNGDGTGSVVPLDPWDGEVYILSAPSFQQPFTFNRFEPLYPDQVVPPLDRLAKTIISVRSRLTRDVDQIRTLLGYGSAPVNTNVPVITGTPYVGQLLTTTDGDWSGSPSNFTYQWRADNVVIPGATSNSLLLASGQAGKSVTVTVTAHNGSGAAAAISAGTADVQDLATVTVLTPPDQTLFLNGSSIDVSASAPGASGATLFLDEGSQGPMVEGADDAFTKTIIAPANDYDMTLRVTANSDAESASGSIKAASTVVDDQFYWDFTSWTLTNIVVTAGQADPFGTNTAYKVIAATGGGLKNYRMTKAGAMPAAVMGGIEVWVSPIGNLLPAIRVYPVNFYGEIKPAQAAPQKNIQYCSVAVVETRIVDGRTWYRIWLRGELNKVLGQFYFDLLGGFLTPNVDIAAGEHGYYMCRPRPVNGILPFYDWQRLAYYYNAVVAGVDEWKWKGPFNDGTDLFDGNEDFEIKVLKPATYDANRAEPYPVVYVMGVEPTPNVNLDEMQVIKTAGYADTYDCLFVEMTFQAFPWGGKAVSGKHDHDKVISQILPKFMSDNFNVSDDPEDRLIMGYSKGGWAAYKFRLVYPDVFGYAGSWDTPWDWTYANLDPTAEQPSFESSAQFDAHKPALLLPSRLSAVTDRTRLWLGSGFTFTDKVTAFHATLQGLGVPHTYAVGLGTAHDAQAAWMGPLLTSLFALRAA